MGRYDEIIAKLIAEEENRKESNRQTNRSNRNKAKAYSQEAPNLSNLIRALYYRYLGDERLGGESEDGYVTGTAPNPSIRGFRPNVGRDTYRAAKQMYSTVNKATKPVKTAKRTLRGRGTLNAEPGQLTYLHRINARGKNWTTSKPSVNESNYSGATTGRGVSTNYFGNELQEGSLEFGTKGDYASAFLDKLNQNKLPAALGLAAGTGVWQGANYYIDNNVLNNSSNQQSNTQQKTNTNKKVNTNTRKQTPVNNYDIDGGSIREIVVKGKQKFKQNSVTNNNSNNQVSKTVAQQPSNSNSATTTRHTDNAKTSDYKIKRGDTLWDIARQYTGHGTKYKELLKYNNIDDPDKIYVGDTIKIPDSWKEEKRNRQIKRENRIKRAARFELPANLDEDYAQLQERETRSERIHLDEVRPHKPYGGLTF